LRALFIEHDHCSPTGPVGERLVQRGYDVTEFIVVPADRFGDPGVQVSFPDPASFDVIVPMGAIWSAYDHELIGSWLVPELALLRSAWEQRIPVLGICFGGQALAMALGGSVAATGQPEIGWHPVRTADPDLIEPGPWFEWHYDRWQPPAAARPLARTDVAPQAFVAGNSLAVQFHPEVTLPVLRLWLDNGGHADLARSGIDIAGLVQQTRQLEAAAVARAARLVDRFLDQVAAIPARGAGRPPLGDPAPPDRPHVTRTQRT
jgi:GMP synthase-like glutamine amidotransferase